MLGPQYRLWGLCGENGSLKGAWWVTGITGFRGNQRALGTVNVRISRTCFGNLPLLGALLPLPAQTQESAHRASAGACFLVCRKRGLGCQVSSDSLNVTKTPGLHSLRCWQRPQEVIWATLQVSGRCKLPRTRGCIFSSETLPVRTSWLQRRSLCSFNLLIEFLREFTKLSAALSESAYSAFCRHQEHPESPSTQPALV